MKKKLLLPFFLLSCCLSYGQCPTEDLLLTTQEEIDNFATNYPNCTSLTIDLTVDGTDSNISNLDGLSVITEGQQIFIKTTPINDLSGLSNLVTVGQFSLWGNQNLQDLTGLSSLETAGGLEVWINAGITSLNGIDNLQTVGTINLFENNNLSDISQLNFVQSLDNSIIGGNALASLSGLENLQNVVGEMIISNELVQNLDELSNLESVDYLYISNNQNLQDISALSNLQSMTDLHITDCPALTNLNGLENVGSISRRLRIGYVPQLTNLSELSGLALVGYVDVYDNANLQSLTGLENLQQIAHRLLVINNPLLDNVEALSNVSAAQVDEVVVLNNASLAVCDNPFLCEVVDNTAVIKSIANNATGCSSVEEIQAECLLGVDVISLENELKIFPNPVSELLTISLSNGILLERATVFSILGQQLMSTSQPYLNMGHLSEGVYLVKVETDKGSIVKRMVKK